MLEVNVNEQDVDGALKDTRFILVRAEYPYVQFVAARVISTENGS